MTARNALAQPETRSDLLEGSVSERSDQMSAIKNISDHFKQVIDEAIKSSLSQRAMTEKEKQAALAGDSSDDSGDDSSNSTPSKTMDDETEKLRQGDIKPRDIVDKLNSIRSGRSFKDSAVASSMDEYITSLSKAERVALLAFLKGIAQIVTGEVPGEQADDPSDAPAAVQMDKSNEPKVVTKKPNVIKGPSQSPKSNKPSVEDTTSPVPIVPKKR